jgi:hypothetical protein
MKKTYKFISYILIFTTLVTTLFSLESSAGGNLRLRRIKGEVYYKNTFLIFSSDWKKVEGVTNIQVGDLIKTIGGSKAELIFSENARVLLKSSSKLKIIKNKSGEVAYKKVKLSVGEIIVKFINEGIKKKEFEVETPSAVAGVRGTLFSVKVGEDKQIKVAVREGRVEVANSAGKVMVGAGELAQVKNKKVKAKVDKLNLKEQSKWNEEKEWLKDIDKWSKEIKAKHQKEIKEKAKDRVKDNRNYEKNSKNQSNNKEKDKSNKDKGKEKDRNRGRSRNKSKSKGKKNK